MRRLLAFSLALPMLPALVAAAVNPSLQSATARLAPGAILLDRVLDLADSPALDGGPGTPPIGPARLRQLAFELEAAGGPAAWPDVEALRDAARPGDDPTLLPLALIDARIARIQGDALETGLLRWEGEQLVPTGAGDPTTTQPLVAAALLRDWTYHGAGLRLILRREQLLRTVDVPAARLALDAGDGLGFRALALDTPFPVRYASRGVKTLTLRATSADGARRYARFTLDVRDLQAPPYDTLWPLTADTPYGGAVATGEAYVYLAPGHATVEKPVVIVEGLDLDNIMGWDELYDLLNQENLLEDMRAMGYDAVVLNFTESTDYIQRNAYLLVTLIEQVQAALADPGQEFVIIGASMGGLVARYALASMEQAGEPHRVSTFISFDSPQNGADIPLGVQYWLDFFSGESADASHLLSRLDRPASRQMLLYHHTSPPTGQGQPDPLRAVLLADLAAVGDYPQNLRKVAVANGSGAGQTQGFVPGEQLIDYTYRSFLVDINGNVWAVPAGNSHIIFEGLIDRIWPLNDDAMNVTVSGTLPLDGAPGGSRASLQEMDESQAPYGDIVALYQSHCFIPTVSALALDSADPFFDIAGAGDLLAHTPFDALYYPVENQPHVLVTPENKAWFIDEITSGETAAGDPLPAAHASLASWPNPFNPATTLELELPRAGRVTLAIYDLAGRQLRTLLDDRRPAGHLSLRWDGRDDTGTVLPSGVYLARLTAADETRWRRLTLLK